MSSVLEKTLSGLVHSILGGANSSNPVSQTFGNPSGLKNVSFGLVNFVEKLQSARRISKQEEQECIEHENKEWVKVLSSPGISSAVVADLLCRALIASVRGYDLPNLHIHAIKLTQCPIVLHKKNRISLRYPKLGPRFRTNITASQHYSAGLNCTKCSAGCCSSGLLPNSCHTRSYTIFHMFSYSLSST